MIMNIHTRAELNKDIEATYKAMAKDLYLRWRHIPSNQVGEMFFLWLCRHRSAKVMGLYQRKARKNLKFAKVKAELDMVKVANEIKTFEETL